VLPEFSGKVEVMNITRSELVKLQQAIAEGHPPKPPSDGEFYWHPKFRLALRLYNSGNGIWIVKYRNQRGLEKTHKIGSATVLNTTAAEDAAKKVLAQVAQGKDPVGERQKLRAKTKITVGELCAQYIEDKRKDPAMGFRTVNGYASVAKHHLGALRGLQADELQPRSVVSRVREIAKDSSWAADTFRAMLASVYKWALTVHPDIIARNPVSGTWRPPRAASTGQALSMEELGAIWRGCELMEARSVPMCRNGHVMKPLRRLDGADDTLIGIREAAKLTGFDHKTLRKAVIDGTLKREFPKPGDCLSYHPPGRHGPLPHLTTVGGINRLLDARPERSQRGDYSKIVRLLILLGARFTEISGLRWSEVDLERRLLHIRTVPQDAPLGHRRIKSRGGKPKDLVLYLPQAAVDIINAVERRPGCDRLFALANGQLKAELDDMICMTEGGDPDAWVAWRKLIRPIQKRKRGDAYGVQTWAVEHVLKTPEGRELYSRLVPRPWRHHWLRHSFTTHLKDMGIAPHLVEAMTNHVMKGEAKTYTHTNFLSQQKPVLDAWARRIRNAADRVVEEEPRSNVRQLFGQSAETA
jgi:integrase